MLLAQAAVGNPGNAALAQIIISVASGMTVIILSGIARSVRRFMKEHEWLIKTVSENTAAIKHILEKENRPAPIVPPTRRRT